MNISLCKYGCGQPGVKQFKDGTWCCSQFTSQCPVMKNKNKIGNIKRYQDPEERKKAKERLDNIRHLCNTEESLNKKSNSIKKVWKDKNSIYNTKEYRKKKSKAQKKHLEENDHPMLGKRHPSKYTSFDIKEKHPFFCEIEEIKDNPITGKIQAHCHYNKCENSKENGGWFDLEYEQLRSRINAIEHPEGNDGLFFYCSEECKKKCPNYYLNPHRIINTNNPNQIVGYDLLIFRQEVFKRQFEKLGYNECEFCGEKNDLIAHHEIPIKINPNFALDPENGIVLCKKCHNIYGHKKGTECSTGNLATRICI